MNNSKRDRNWLIIAILAVAIAAIWLTISIVQTLTKTTVPPDVTTAITPIDPVIDQQAQNLLEKRSENSK